MESPESGVRNVYDTMVNAVTTAENKPAYNVQRLRVDMGNMDVRLTKINKLPSSSFQSSIMR